MRGFARVMPTFWTGETGRAIRMAGVHTQLVALYLLTAPGSSMIGIYYLPLSSLCHEVGISLARARGALAVLERLGFARYDPIAELVFIPEMARYQIGETLQPGDNRLKMICRILAGLKSHPFAVQFHEKYRQTFHLPKRWSQAPTQDASKDLPTPSEAPSKPGEGKGAGAGTGIGIKTFAGARATHSTPAVSLTEHDFAVTPELLTRWEETYPAVNVRLEVRQAFEWVQGHPENRKSNWQRFLAGWLKRAQDHAPTRRAMQVGDSTRRFPHHTIENGDGRPVPDAKATRELLRTLDKEVPGRG